MRGRPGRGEGPGHGDGDAPGGAAGDGTAPADPLAGFHPAVAEWFRRRFPGGPTAAQAQGWRSIAAGQDTLIAAPTGSGKTLAGFLVAIDRCLRAVIDRGRCGTAVVYVSPLRALTVDVKENLETPLEEIAAIAAELGLDVPALRVAVRNGDTPPSARAQMLRDKPEIVVTTPESLYLLLTAARGRELLRTVETVIVDEIHALARDKRGSHLSLSLERLDRVVASAEPGRRGPRRPTRIGLSATQRPVELVARLLVGSGPDRSNRDGSPRCAIVDTGHRRALDLAIELPGGELEAVMATEQLHETVARIGELIAAHHSTLVFVNTRRMAERVAHLLGELLGEGTVSAHHGSLSTPRRLGIEQRLRAGELRAVVTTSSLELGIDVGPVDLVCQLSSSRAIATFLQRVGRAEHRLDGVPKGRIFPLTRDELVEAVALFGAIDQGDLDTLIVPAAPLDILAQQVVAETAAAGEDGIAEAELLELVRHAAPYAALPGADFESVVELVSSGVTTGRGQRGAHLHRDRVNGVLRPRRGARLTAATSGGAIPELADYKVVLEPDEAVVGTISEDWAVETMAGDVFLLGSHAWRVRRVEQMTVRVVDAEGLKPTIPFWFGEAPARTTELADAICQLRRLVETSLRAAGAGAGAEVDAGGTAAGPAGGEPATPPPATGIDLTAGELVGGWPPAAIAAAREAVTAWAGVDERVAEEVVAYLGAALAQLGTLPTKERLVLERFFDDSGGMQLVVHSPYGARINRGLGLALRKKFCRSFDFELQAAANDDAVVLSLGPQHSFPIEEVTRYLSPANVRDTLEQAVLPTPIFGSRWRWNLSRSLVSPRYRGGRHLPPLVQRMESDDLMAAIFPALAACQENVSGPIVLPDHPIVRQTMRDCMTEAMDLEGLTELVSRLRAGEVGAVCVDVPEPSLLAHEIINGRPYTYLDDAPLEERRTRAVSLRRGIPLEAHDLTRLDPSAVAEVIGELVPELRNAEELHDLLTATVLLPPLPEPEAVARFEELAAAGRAMVATAPGVPGAPAGAAPLQRWCATERRAQVEAIWPGATFAPDHRLPEALSASPPPPPEEALEQAVRGHLELTGPAGPELLAARIGAGGGEVRSALAALERRGAVLQLGEGEWCERRIVARIHARSRDRERARHAPVSTQHLMRLLLRWQHVAEGTRLAGVHGLAEVVGQLQGLEAPVGAFEESILPARVAGYAAHLLDELAANGELGWGRLTPRPDSGAPKRGGSVPSRATPVALARRGDLDWLLAAVRVDDALVEPGPGAAADVLEALREHGALFFADLCEVTGRLPTEVAEGLWDAVARGQVSADGFSAVRALLSGRYRDLRQRRSSPGGLRRGWWRAGGGSAPARPAGVVRPGSPAVAGTPQPRPAPLPRPAAGGRTIRPALTGGRWSLLDAPPASAYEREELAEAVAGQLLTRWGVVYRDIALREGFALPWRDVLYALRRMEARGVVRGGRFVSSLVGEQYALPEALDALRRVAAEPLDGSALRLSAADPLNLTGLLLPGPRVPALRGRTILLVDGVVVAEEGADRGAAGGAGSGSAGRRRGAASPLQTSPS